MATDLIVFNHVAFFVLRVRGQLLLILVLRLLVKVVVLSNDAILELHQLITIHTLEEAVEEIFLSLHRSLIFWLKAEY